MASSGQKSTGGQPQTRGSVLSWQTGSTYARLTGPALCASGSATIPRLFPVLATKRARLYHHAVISEAASNSVLCNSDEPLAWLRAPVNGYRVEHEAPVAHLLEPGPAHQVGQRVGRLEAHR